MMSRFSEFIRTHADDSVKDLYLRYHGKELGFDVADAIVQIECRRKTRRKLAKFIGCPEFYFPCTEVAEQSTHQCVAAFHASLIGKGKRVVDMTAGLGIDAITFALNGNDVTAIELSENRYEALVRNSTLYACEIKECHGRLQVVQGDSLRYLEDYPEKFDVLFADPARRDSDSNRLFMLSRCLPDVVANQKLLRNKASKLIIKASPLLDITQSAKEIDYVSEIILVCVKGECKEVLIIANPEIGPPKKDEVQIRAIDLNDRTDGAVEIISDWSCRLTDIVTQGEIASDSDLRPGNYLYDPNSAMHKIRAGKRLSEDYAGLKQISPNTHLFVSPNLYGSFPGRVFCIVETLTNKDAKRLKGTKAEVMSRNYPLSAEALSKKLKLKPGGDEFILGTCVGTNQSPLLLRLRKV